MVPMMPAFERFHCICIDFRPYIASFWGFSYKSRILWHIKALSRVLWNVSCGSSWVHEGLFQNERNATLFSNYVILDFSALQISIFYDMLWGMYCVNFRLSNLKLLSANLLAQWQSRNILNIQAWNILNKQGY